MNRKPSDSGSFSQWRSGDRTIINKDVDTESGKLESADAVGTCRMRRNSEEKPFRKNKRRRKDSAKRHQRHPHRDIEESFPQKVRAKKLLECILQTEYERLEAEGSEEKLDDLDRASRSLNDFMNKFADEKVEFEDSSAATVRPNPNDLILKKFKMHLTMMVQKYEQELDEWESVQSHAQAFANSAVQVIQASDRDYRGTDIDSDELDSEVANALDTFVFHADVVLKEHKRLEMTNNSTETQVESIAKNIISRYNHAESSTKNFVSIPPTLET